MANPDISKRFGYDVWPLANSTVQDEYSRQAIGHKHTVNEHLETAAGTICGAAFFGGIAVASEIVERVDATAGEQMLQFGASGALIFGVQSLYFWAKAHHEQRQVDVLHAQQAQHRLTLRATL